MVELNDEEAKEIKDLIQNFRIWLKGKSKEKLKQMLVDIRKQPRDEFFYELCERHINNFEEERNGEVRRNT